MIGVAVAGVAFVACLIGLLVTLDAAVPPWLLWGAGAIITLVAFWRLALEEIQRRADDRQVERDRKQMAARIEPLRTPGNVGRLPE